MRDGISQKQISRRRVKDLVLVDLEQHISTDFFVHLSFIWEVVGVENVVNKNFSFYCKLMGTAVFQYLLRVGESSLPHCFTLEDKVDGHLLVTVGTDHYFVLAQAVEHVASGYLLTMNRAFTVAFSISCGLWRFFHTAISLLP